MAINNNDYQLQEDGTTQSTTPISKQKNIYKDIETCHSDEETWSYYMARSNGLPQDLKDDESISPENKVVIQRLAMRSYHLPGNTYLQDWNQFVFNNHSVYGLCFADKRHPLDLRHRIVNLVASISFGLAATSTTVLWYYFEGRDMNRVVFSITTNVGLGIELTEGMLVLYLVGGVLQCSFDFTMWYIQACPCCRPGGWNWPRNQKIWIWIGTHIALEMAIIATVLAVCVILLRASVSDDTDDVVATGVKHYAFVANFLVLLVISLLVYWPIMAFGLFSGVLGCGVVPILGGRQAEIRALKRQRRRWSRKQDEREYEEWKGEKLEQTMFVM